METDETARVEGGEGEGRWERNSSVVVFFFNDPATTEIYTLSLHDALPISQPVKLILQSHYIGTSYSPGY